MKLTQYQTLVFDCDGVILNSNKVKTEAFFKAALPYGEAAAHKLVDYHVANGGISRYAKFEYFLIQILQQPFDDELNQDLLERFANAVKQGLMNCEVAEGLDQLKVKTPNANWLIVSGGDQQELREVFAERGLAELFDGGIFGSPDSKESILDRELATENIKQPALFFGDSKYDYSAAKHAGLDFLFLHGWTEVSDWRDFCQSNHIESFGSLMNLIYTKTT